MKTSFVFLTVLALLAMLMAGCTVPGGPSSTPTPIPTTTPSLPSGMGMIKVYVTDPPPPEMDEIWVDIKNLDVHKAGGGWATVAEDPGEFNLKAIEGIQQYLAVRLWRQVNTHKSD